jgi:hypothetical protein
MVSGFDAGVAGCMQYVVGAMIGTAIAAPSYITSDDKQVSIKGKLGYSVLCPYHSTTDLKALDYLLFGFCSRRCTFGTCCKVYQRSTSKEASG